MILVHFQIRIFSYNTIDQNHKIINISLSTHDLLIMLSFKHNTDQQTQIIYCGNDEILKKRYCDGRVEIYSYVMSKEDIRYFLVF